MSLGVIASQAFSPNKFPGLNLWQDYSDIATLTEIGGFVSQGGDKSRKGHNAVQLTGARQPQTGISSIGGRNVSEFPSLRWGFHGGHRVVPNIGFMYA